MSEYDRIINTEYIKKLLSEASEKEKEMFMKYSKDLWSSIEDSLMNIKIKFNSVEKDKEVVLIQKALKEISDV